MKVNKRLLFAFVNSTFLLNSTFHVNSMFHVHVVTLIYIAVYTCVYIYKPSEHVTLVQCLPSIVCMSVMLRCTNMYILDSACCLDVVQPCMFTESHNPVGTCRRNNIVLTSMSHRIKVSMMSFRCHVPAGNHKKNATHNIFRQQRPSWFQFDQSLLFIQQF